MAEQKADPVPGMQVLTSPLVHCNSALVKPFEAGPEIPKLSVL